MSLNLNKHGASMQAAWKEVLDSNNPTNWALFGYEGNTFDLKLISKGSEGIEEMIDDLNANKIMYAFCQVEDPKTSLPKYVLVNWQGESAPGTRKGLCATHLKDVANYFRGSHLTFYARDEDEMNIEEIREKVAKVSATSYNFKEKPMAAMEDIPGPVGSRHQRIIPERELPDLSARERFWQEEQNREKERIATERERKKEEYAKLEAERIAREEAEAKRREAEVTEKERKISQIKEAERAGSTVEKSEAARWQAQLEEDRREEELRRNRSEEMRRMRNEEAKQLIGQKSSEVKAVFERNSSAGQFNFKRQSSSNGNVQTSNDNTTRVVVEASSPINGGNVSRDAEIVPPPPIFGNDSAAGDAANSPPDVACETADSRPDVIQDVLPQDAPGVAPPDVASESARVDSSADETAGHLGVCAVALYDYQAADDTEISFDPNQVVTNIDKIDPGWWQGLGPTGHYGLFPANYVECIDASKAAMLLKQQRI